MAKFVENEHLRIQSDLEQELRGAFDPNDVQLPELTRSEQGQLNSLTQQGIHPRTFFNSAIFDDAKAVVLEEEHEDNHQRFFNMLGVALLADRGFTTLAIEADVEDTARIAAIREFNRGAMSIEELTPHIPELNRTPGYLETLRLAQHLGLGIVPIDTGTTVSTRREKCIYGFKSFRTYQQRRKGHSDCRD